MKLIILLSLLTCSNVRGQFIQKKDIPAYACLFGAGASYGIAESIIWHPKSDTHFWNPYVEGKSKVDAYHLARLSQNAFILGAVVLSINDFKKPKFWDITKKVLLCSISYQAGQVLTYNIILK